MGKRKALAFITLKSSFIFPIKTLEMCVVGPLPEHRTAYLFPKSRYEGPVNDRLAQDNQICIEELSIWHPAVIWKALLEINHTILCFALLVGSLPLFYTFLFKIPKLTPKSVWAVASSLLWSLNHLYKYFFGLEGNREKVRMFLTRHCQIAGKV